MNAPREVVASITMSIAQHEVVGPGSCGPDPLRPTQALSER